MTEQYRNLTDEEIFFYPPTLAQRYGVESTASYQNKTDEYFYRSNLEADRLGFEVWAVGRQPMNPVVVVSETIHDNGDKTDQAKALAERFDLNWSEANAGFHVLDQRRDGDAIVALVGSRHLNDFWYTVVVAWSPEALAKRLYEGERFDHQPANNGNIWMTTGLM